MELKKQILHSTLEALKREVEKEEIAPDKVAALAEAIKAINSINPMRGF